MIFNGIEIMFYTLGVLTAVGVFILMHYSRYYLMKLGSYLSGGFAIFLMLFTIAWAWSSVLEGEPQAAGMGLLVFGVPAVILFFLTRKLILKSEKKDLG